MRPQRESRWRQFLRFGRGQYRKAFSGKTGAYVLADLRNYCQCKPGQLQWEYLERESRTDPEAYKEHMARARVYHRIRRFVELSEDEIDAAEENIAAMGGEQDG